MNPCRVLIVEDEAIVAMDIRDRLAGMGYELAGHVASGEQAVALVQQERPDLVLMDIRLRGEMDGIAAAEEIHRRFSVPVIFLTAYSEDATLDRAKLAEPFGYILKPFDDRELKSAIEIALYKHRAEEEIRRMNRLYDVLSQVNQAVVHIRTPEELLPTVCRLLVERGTIDLAWVGWLDPATSRIDPVAHFGNQTAILAETQFYADGRDQEQGDPGKAIRAGEPVVSRACGSECCPHPIEKAPVRFGFESCGSFPLRFQGRICGVLNLCAAEPEFFREREIELLKEVAMDVSFALDKMEGDAQRERLHERFQSQSAFLETLMDAMPHPVFYKDAQLRYLGCNSAFERFLGVRRDQLLGKTVHDIWPRDLADDYDRSDRELLASGSAQLYETRALAADGVRHDVLSHKATFANPDGSVGGIIGAIEDITERTLAEARIRRQNAVLNCINRIFLEALNSRTEEDLGRLCLTIAEELTGSRFGFIGEVGADGLFGDIAVSDPGWEACRVFTPAGRHKLPAGLEIHGIHGRVLKDGKGFFTNDPASHPDRIGLPPGHPPIEAFLGVPLIRSGRTVGMIAVGNRPGGYGREELEALEALAPTMVEAFSRKRAEQALRESEERLNLALAASQMGVWEWDVRTNAVFWSPEISKIIGMESFGGSLESFKNLVHPEDAARVRTSAGRALAERSVYAEELRVIHPSGEVRWVSNLGQAEYDDAGNPLRMVGIVQDITERKRAEEERARFEVQLRQAQKMEALGTLAGGIAHDFNNILGIILGYTEMVLWDNQGGKDRSKLEEVIKATQRAKELVQQILAFSRQSDQEKKPVQIGLIVKEALRMLRASLPSTIEIKSKVTTKEAVLADPSQIHQVLMNLCTNAAHALQDGGGILEVELTEVHLEAEAIPAYSGLRPGPHVRLTVKDTGCGIDPTIVDRIFEPFFTTKGVGIGTGLGLAVVHGIVKSHGGAIEVSSVPRKGTTFRVLFPAIGKAPRMKLQETPLPTGQGRILVVDDEPALAIAVQKMLERLGYEVDSRTSSIEALEAFRNQPADKSYDLVITDMTMPHFTGADLAEQLHRLQPDLRLILCTGFSEKIDSEKAGRLGFQGFLMKPIVLRELAELIRKILDKG